QPRKLPCMRATGGRCVANRATMAEPLSIVGHSVGLMETFMTMSLDAAAQVMREAMRETVKRHSLWYLVQGGVMIVAGILALVYPIASSFAVVLLLGWLLIISGVVQGISLFDARNVPHFWLQLVSVVLSVIVGVLLIRHRGEGLLVLTLLLL